MRPGRARLKPAQAQGSFPLQGQGPPFQALQEGQAQDRRRGGRGTGDPRLHPRAVRGRQRPGERRRRLLLLPMNLNRRAAMARPRCSRATARNSSAPVKAGGSGETEAVCEDGSAAGPGGRRLLLLRRRIDAGVRRRIDPHAVEPRLDARLRPQIERLSGAAEVGCEEGTLAVQAPDGSYSCVGSSEPGCESAPAPHALERTLDLPLDATDES